MAMSIARREMLLNAYKQICTEWWRLEGMALTTPELRQHKLKVDRVKRALFKDCQQAGEAMDEIQRWLWEKRIHHAGILPEAGTSKGALKKESSERDYPSGLKADQLPLPDTEG